MWGGKKRSNTSKINTLIGQHTILAGDVRFTGGLHVEGEIKGNVLADDEKNTVLILSETGVIEGDVSVPSMVLNGTVQGDVYSTQRLDLLACTRINGNVYYNFLEMAGGAEVNGNLVHRTEGETSVKTKLKEESEEMPMAIVDQIVQTGNNS
jgi:cytoskeletal protein CcmA (bactofilin family)